MNDTNGYLGFIFDGHHSSEFGLLVVSDGSRYHQDLFSNFSDTILTVPGKSGGYFFGTQKQMRDFDIECVFDNINTHIRNKIQNWLYPDKVGWLIFDESPYKKYLVKISGVPQFNYLPFSDYSSTKNFYLDQDILKGELSISFFSFQEYAIGNQDYDLPNIATNSVIPQYALDSGLLPSNYKTTDLFFSQKSKRVDGNTNFYIYNAGNGIATADFYFWIASNNNTEWPIHIFNYDDGESYIINNFTEEITTVNGMYMIQILGSKKEIWAYGQVSAGSFQINESTKKNIGGYYNHFYPKIYHKKPTEIAIINQSVDSNGGTEQLYFPLTIVEPTNFYSSDEKNIKKYSFEEFKSYWSDYMLCTKENLLEINDTLTPNILYTEYQYVNPLKEELVYFIYPNKFLTNTTLFKFTPVYENTYI